MCGGRACIDDKGNGRMDDVKVIVGGSIEDEAATFLDAWQHAARGKKVP
jgi:hypothetical protein